MKLKFLIIDKKYRKSCLESVILTSSFWVGYLIGDKPFMFYLILYLLMQLVIYLVVIICQNYQKPV